MFLDQFLVAFNAIGADAEKLRFRLKSNQESRKSQVWSVHPGDRPPGKNTEPVLKCEVGELYLRRRCLRLRLL
jgi:hypothetical protein